MMNVAPRLVAKRNYMLLQMQQRYASRHLKHFATIDPGNLSTKDKGMNLVQGEWTGVAKYSELVDPLTGKPMISIPDTSMQELEPFVESLQAVPKSGVHNPFKNKERYIMLGEVCRKTAEVLHEQETFDFFVDCVIRCVPKSKA